MSSSVVEVIASRSDLKPLAWTNWCLVQGLAHLHPVAAGIVSSPPPADPEFRIENGWMNAWMEHKETELFSHAQNVFMFELHLIKHSTRGQHHHDPFKILHVDLVKANNILTLSQKRLEKRQTHITNVGSIFISFHTILFPTSWILDQFNLI